MNESHKSSSFTKHLAWTAVTSFGVMGINLITGVLVSRLLEPSGRGQIAAIGTWTQTLGWAAGMGFYEALTYMRARNEEAPSRMLGTAMLVTVVFGTIWLIIAELLISSGFHGQTPLTILLARLWMFTVYSAVGSSMLNAMVSGDQQFGLFNLLRILQPVVYLLGLLVVWMLHRFNVVTVLCMQTGVDLAITGYTLIHLLRTVGLGLPSMRILKTGLSYGMRVQGSLFASLANARLDMLLLPSMIAGTVQIGLYSVSCSLSSLVISLLGSFSVVVFPAAARAGKREGLRMVGRSLRFVVYAGGLGSAAFFILCPYLLHFVYGSKFDGAVPSLRLLLLGGLALAATKIVDGGLQSVNKPMKATYAQLFGIIVTIVGLYLLLRPMGIAGAALTSTASYLVSFFVSLYFLAQESDFSLADAFSFPAFADDVAGIVAKARGAIRPLSSTVPAAMEVAS